MSVNLPAGPQSGLPSRVHRLAYLDGIRALAALWVLLDHTFAFTLGTTVSSPGVAGVFVHYGHLAVDLFIVLSGYCLMLPVATRGELGGSPLWFYGRRVRRILPPYFAILGILLAHSVLHHIVKGSPLPPWRAVGLNVLLLQDWVLSANIFDSPTWSVAAEWKIYFLFPVFVWAWRRRGAIAMLGLAAVVGYGITLLDHVTGVYDKWACPWYVVLFALGAAACALRKRLSSAVLGSLCLVGAVGTIIALRPASLVHWWDFAVLDTCMGLFAATTLVLLHDAPSRGFLVWRPLVGVGTFSYSLYLTHVPLILTLMSWPSHAPRLWAAHGAHQAYALGEIGVAIGAAYLFFLCFERPFLSSRRRETPAELARDAALSPAP